MKAQVSIDSNVDSVKYQKKSSDKIRIRCIPTNSFVAEPLLIVDGIPVELEKFKGLIPGDIASITVLKDGKAAAIYSCRPINGVILVTTKSARLRKFRIRDVLDGSDLAGATVSFISIGDKNDTLIFVSNDSGLITTDKLNAGVEYKITITSAGYKTLSVVYKNTNANVNSFSMERDVVNCAPVTVTAMERNRRCRMRCCIGGISICHFTTTKDIIDNSWVLKFYPNPVQLGRDITIETYRNQDGQLYVNVIAPDGRRLLSHSQKTYQGNNRFSLNIDNRWSEGVYLLQVLDEKRNIIKTEKVVIE